MTPDEVRCDSCALVGSHLCWPRAQRVIDVFAQFLVHTKGRFARRPFILEPWQRDDIIVPLFGTVEWSTEFEQWVRVYRVVWIEVARKNGKSELCAAIALALLIADDEEGAEIYGAARDREQARKVYDVAERMVELSPLLRRRLRPYKQTKTLVNSRLNGFYKIISADAPGNLGHNVHGAILDEVLTQPDGELSTALRTSTGTRTQPLFVYATTAGEDQESYAWHEHEYALRVAGDPEYDRRWLVFIRNMPTDADPFDEANWAWPNPALGSFLSLEALRDDAREAQNDPAKENAFRQFRCNQWRRQVSRWMPMEQWDRCVGPAGKAASPAELDGRVVGQRCWGGLDLSAKYDLTALSWFFPALDFALWRFWIPEEQVPELDRLTGGIVSPWVKAGWLMATPGATIDYQLVYDQVDVDRDLFKVQDLNYDPNMAAPVIRELEGRGLKAVQVSQGFAMSEPIKETMRRVKSGELSHGGHPVARWNAECVEVKQDHYERLFMVKPKRGMTGKRIDGMVALVMAIDGVMRRGADKPKSRRVVGF